MRHHLRLQSGTACPRPARAARAALLAALLLAAGGGVAPAWAEHANANEKMAEATRTYQRDRADCLAGRSNEDRATCLREAGAALQRARTGDTGEDPSQWDRNRLARCQLQPPEDRDECVRRMNEGTVTGSVEGGGILREHTSIVPAR